jgi:hypothetical protein
VIEGRGLVAVASIAKDEIVAIKGGHIVDTLVALEEAEYEPVVLFLNHSCEPNVGFAGNTVLVAMRDIDPGEELTTDYALFDHYDGEMDCRCGTASCRRTINGRDWRCREPQAGMGSTSPAISCVDSTARRAIPLNRRHPHLPSPFDRQAA